MPSHPVGSRHDKCSCLESSSESDAKSNARREYEGQESQEDDRAGSVECAQLHTDLGGRARTERAR